MDSSAQGMQVWSHSRYRSLAVDQDDIGGPVSVNSRYWLPVLLTHRVAQLPHHQSVRQSPARFSQSLSHSVTQSPSQSVIMAERKRRILLDDDEDETVQVRVSSLFIS